MSIRKRLFISNTAMIVLPILIIMIIFILLHIILSNDTNFNGYVGQDKGQPVEGSNIELFNELKKIASLEEEKLLDQAYISALPDQFNNDSTNILIRKGTALMNGFQPSNEISIDDLPPFGNEGFNQAGVWLGNDHYSIKQHDFYFQDGTPGSIFLLDNTASFVNTMRTVFPFLFVGLIVLLILINVILSYFMSQSILRPVKQLSEASTKISKGELDFTMGARGRDELGQLVQTFDDMRAQLQESITLRNKYENNRKELVANISHDLKTPITTIMGYVEGIQDGVANTNDKQARYLDTIHTKATYMNRLIEELSLFSKLDVKKVPFHFESVDIQAFIKDYLEDIADDLKDKGIQLSLSGTLTSATVKIDRDKIIRVLENIIYNSVKYNNKSTGKITVSLTDEGKIVKVMIFDNGPGISQAALTTIFQRFYRIDPARSKEGSGLGLAIASQIIEAHSGTIWAENLRTEGLAIYFTLRKSEEDGDNHA
ncbi:two-component sensor histidine kinase [Oceanobacillus arenosus]|uniref:histidine kinase n=1 Tax=Oceanobacillus arenosus TaxID=1229153 RepID=A0A3D8Q313_9BACI|nr:HAMP domain-containing sensor histidine kinase [Oceanobacillus arenosus]RDW22437.1 two-component sensor histidine kinase [Oceanobacillus arenosus]